MIEILFYFRNLSKKIYLFRSYSSFFFRKKVGGLKKKIKDYFVSDSHYIYRWMGAYSESESWGVLPDNFYKFQAPINLLFLLSYVMHKYPFQFG